MAIYRNQSNQRLAVYAYTLTTGLPKTGDAAHITCHESIDWGAADQLDDVNPTELDATNMKGWYVFDLTQAETNGESLVFAPVSSTAGVALDQVQIVTQASVNQTGDAYARLGAPAGASVSADIAAIEAQTDDIGAAGAGLTAVPWNGAWDAEVESEVDDALGADMGAALTAIPWNAAWDAEVQSEAADALNAYDPPTNAEMEARTILAASYFDPAADTVANVNAVASVAAVNGLADNIITAASIAAGAIRAEAIADDAIDAGAIAANAIDADALKADAVTKIQVGLAKDATVAKAATTALETTAQSILADTGTTLDAKIDSILADTGVDGVVVAAASKTGYRLSATGVDDVLDEVVKGTYTLRQAMSITMAVLAGVVSGGGTATITFQHVDGSGNAVVATVDASGNRSPVTITP